MTTDSRPAPDGEPSLPDDVWEQFLNDSERAIRSSAPKEPSARARMVARRLRDEEERAAVLEAGRSRWSRFGRRRRASAEPAAWRSGRTDAGDRRARRRSRLRGFACLVLVVAVVLFLLAPGRVLSLFRG